MTRAAIAYMFAAIAVSVAVWWIATSRGAGSDIADAGPGLVLAVLAAAAAVSPGRREVGAVAAIAAALWFAGGWDALQWMHRGALAWLVLAYPHIRLRPRWAIAVVAAAFVAATVPMLVAAPAATVVLSAAVVVAAALRLRRSSRIARRPVAVALAAATVLAATWSVPIVLALGGASAPLPLAVYLCGTASVGLLLLVDVTLGRSTEPELVGVVIDLGGVTDRGMLRGRLARLVGDPDLWLGYQLADGRYVDDAGLPAPWEGAPPDRVVTPIDDDGRRLAVLIHDRSVRIDPTLLPEIAVAVSLALRNVELHAEVRARVAEVEDSRDRLLVAETDARRGFEGDLERGPRLRIQHVAALLERINGEIDDSGRVAGISPLADAVARAQEALRRFGQGLLPAALDGGDLAGALERLAHGFPFDVEVHAEVSALAPGPRAAVWYICAEALANAAKHADARRVTISIEPGEHGVILVTIRDDGRGGAAMDAGTGLRGIRHRAEAQLGGLEVLSPPEGGTVVRAWLPDGPPITNARDVK